MTNLELTEDKIYNKEISLCTHEFTNIKACSIKMDNKYTIFFNPHLFENTSEVNTALAHEYYHCEYDCFYSFSDTYQQRQKMEFKANYQMALDLCPPKVVKLYMDRGIELWELADFLQLTEKFVLMAVQIYKTKGLL